MQLCNLGSCLHPDPAAQLPPLLLPQATAPAGVRMLADLGGLSRLQALTLRAGHCFLSPYLRLPSSLTMLEILAKSVQVWEDEGGASRADLSNLSRLERLVLQHEAALQSMRPLSRLGRLQVGGRAPQSPSFFAG